jgi:PAS domain-containing protein
LVFARPMDQLIRAERALQEFVQTLTKTFGDLPTGLAVFNRKRELVLFNPALTDLTSLKPLFLSTQPTLFAFLDQLRNKQRMPEPKDYKTWRQGIIDLEAAAEQGTYHEDWYLPTGQTYRVTGQPHPDGAIAFLFEDISAEVSLTRRFRTEVELGQAVIDSLDEAIAILSRDGTVTLSNQAYADLWGTNPTEALGEIRLKDVLQNWTNTCHSTGFWDELIAYHNDESARAPKTAELQMRDGRCLICRLAPVAGAAMLVGFTVVSNSGNSVRGVTHPPRKAAT